MKTDQLRAPPPAVDPVEPGAAAGASAVAGASGASGHNLGAASKWCMLAASNQYSMKDPMTPIASHTEAELVARLERTVHSLTKRVYAPSLRALYESDQPDKLDKLDKGSMILLATIDEHGELRPSDLAVLVSLDLSTVSRHLSYFEQLDLIARTPDPLDRRASRITLTDRGRAGLAAIRATRTAWLDSVFAGWSATDRSEFYRLLTQLGEGLAALPTATRTSA
jgi:DNA-binding MarR family transcriptional regulator